MDYGIKAALVIAPII